MTLPNNLWLAPMAGTTEPIFRALCRRFGAGLTVTELVSARGIRYHGITPQQYRYLEICPAEKPVLIQLFGFDPEDFRRAVAAIMDHPLLSTCTGIDINMGCPVKKVVKTGAGSALMKAPAVARSIVKAVQAELQGTDKSISVKFRKGFDQDSCTAPDFALTMAAAGVDFICVHGRTAAQQYGGLADRSAIAKTVRALRARGIDLPVIANGDITGVVSARQTLAETGADGLMVGRSAQGNPWIFRELAAGLTGYFLTDQANPCSAAVPAAPLVARPPEPPERCFIILEHLDGLIARLGESLAVKEMRGQLVAYFKGLPGAVAIRRQCVQVASRADVVELLNRWRREQVQT